LYLIASKFVMGDEGWQHIKERYGGGNYG
jgi:hypothetical protein